MGLVVFPPAKQKELTTQEIESLQRYWISLLLSVAVDQSLNEPR